MTGATIKPLPREASGALFATAMGVIGDCTRMIVDLYLCMYTDCKGLQRTAGVKGGSNSSLQTLSVLM